MAAGQRMRERAEQAVQRADRRPLVKRAALTFAVVLVTSIPADRLADGDWGVLLPAALAALAAVLSVLEEALERRLRGRAGSQQALISVMEERIAGWLEWLEEDFAAPSDEDAALARFEAAMAGDADAGGAGHMTEVWDTGTGSWKAGCSCGATSNPLPGREDAERWAGRHRDA